MKKSLLLFLTMLVSAAVWAQTIVQAPAKTIPLLYL